MEKAYTAFATQVIELCIGSPDTNRTIIALAYIEIELQHHPVRNLPEEKKEIANYVSKALSFVRKMQKFLAAPQEDFFCSFILPNLLCYMIIFHSIFYLTYTLARFLVILLTIFLSPLFLLYAKSQQQIPIPSLQIAISSFFCNFIDFNCRHFI